MAFFFATADDLLPVLLEVEAKRSIVYTPFGHFHDPSAKHYRSGKDLPTLFEPQPYESSVLGPAYLVTEAGTAVAFRELTRRDGKDCWSVDQLDNEDSTVLQHGGPFKDNVLLPGEVRTASTSAVARRLQRAFDAVIRRHFVRIQAYFVGPAAEAMLDSGFRLTSAEQCPLEFDLRR